MINTAPAAAINATARNVREATNICPTYLENWEYWHYINKKGQPVNYSQKITSRQITEHTGTDYPTTWQRGSSFIFIVQSEYYQHETEEGEKQHGYSRENIFYTPEAAHAAAAIAKGDHPSRHGFNLCPIV